MIILSRFGITLLSLLWIVSQGDTKAMDDFSDKFRQIRIGDRFQLIRRLGTGSFGAIYLAISRDSRYGTLANVSQGKTYITAFSLLC